MQNIQKYRRMKNLFFRDRVIWMLGRTMGEVSESPSYAQWDYVVLTASNEAQAMSFEEQIAWRRNKVYLRRIQEDFW